MACDDSTVQSANAGFDINKLEDGSSSKVKTLLIYSYITEKLYEFEAYIYKFNFNIQTTIKEELPFGRSSRIYTHGGTNRGDIQISFFELVNNRDRDGIDATYSRASRLIKEMYPKYSDINNSLTMTQAPLVRIFCRGFITNGYVDTGEDPANWDDRLPYGQLGYIKSLDIDFDREQNKAFGHFMDKDAWRYANIPPKLDYRLVFAPIDDFALGLDEGGTETGTNWPMGFDSSLTTQTSTGDTFIQADSLSFSGVEISGEGADSLDESEINALLVTAILD